MVCVCEAGMQAVGGAHVVCVGGRRAHYQENCLHFVR